MSGESKDSARRRFLDHIHDALGDAIADRLNDTGIHRPLTAHERQAVLARLSWTVQRQLDEAIEARKALDALNDAARRKDGGS